MGRRPARKGTKPARKKAKKLSSAESGKEGKVQPLGYSKPLDRDAAVASVKGQLLLEMGLSESDLDTSPGVLPYLIAAGILGLSAAVGRRIYNG
jgi:hypothetical protein